jgi:hypothetical protein
VLLKEEKEEEVEEAVVVVVAMEEEEEEAILKALGPLTSRTSMYNTSSDGSGSPL